MEKINWNKPIPSVPILLDKKTLKEIPAVLSTSEDTMMIRALTIIFFNDPLLAYFDLRNICKEQTS
jgi:hypothetical protein